MGRIQITKKFVACSALSEAAGITKEEAFVAIHASAVMDRYSANQRLDKLMDVLPPTKVNLEMINKFLARYSNDMDAPEIVSLLRRMTSSPLYGPA